MPTKPRPTILFIVHAWGGGTIRFAVELAAAVAKQADVVWAWGVENKTLHVSRRGPYYSEQEFDLTAGLNASLQALRALQCDRVALIETIGLQDHIGPLLARLGLRYDVIFTDYHYFSPTPHFEDATGRFAGDAALAKRDFDEVSPLLRGAERRIAISRDLSWRLARLMRGMRIVTAQVSEPDRSADNTVKRLPLRDGGTMRVLVLGLVHPAKGLATISDVARRAEREKLPIEVISLGACSPELADGLRRLAPMRVLGGYAQEDLARIVVKLNPHMAWLPFTVPETHSYALSDIMRAGLPLLATGIGAVPERVVGRPATWLIPFEQSNADRHYDWLLRLYRERLQTPPAHLPVDHLPAAVKEFFPKKYLKPLQPGLLARLLGRV